MSIELAMEFIGVNCSSMPPDRRRSLCKATHDLAAALASIPVDLGKYSQYGRGLIARRELLGTPVVLLHFTTLVDIFEKRRIPKCGTIGICACEIFRSAGQ